MITDASKGFDLSRLDHLSKVARSDINSQKIDGAVFPSAFGTLASPATFGGIRSGSNCFWVDPISQVSYFFLSSGLLEAPSNWVRHQLYAELDRAAVTD